jgi:hypothetical protein
MRDANHKEDIQNETGTFIYGAFPFPVALSCWTETWSKSHRSVFISLSGSGFCILVCLCYVLRTM